MLTFKKFYVSEAISRRNFLAILGKAASLTTIDPNTVTKIVSNIAPVEVALSDTRLRQNYISKFREAADEYIYNYAQNLEDSGTLDLEGIDFEDALENGWDYLNSLDLDGLIEELEPFVEDKESSVSEDPINYSRFDKAGSSEDTEYAKYYEKYITEADMGRREFIKKVGKGAASVGVTPKGVVGKALINVVSPTAKALSNAPAAKTFSDIVMEMYNATWETEDDDPLKIVNSLENAYKNGFNFLQQNNLVTPSLQFTFTKAINALSRLKARGDFDRDDIVEIGCDWLYDYENELLYAGYRNNLIDKNTEKKIHHYYSRQDVFDNKKEYDERLERIKQDKIQKEKDKRSERGSRFDYAGGSEDVGYAKYWESAFNR
jgi:hypothetical protein